MTEDQKRELTERIAKWIKPLDHNWSETYDGDYCKRCMNPSWHDDTAEFCDPIYYLDSRDDWALVEEEIEKRGLWENYITVLGRLLGLIMDGCYISSFACGEFRRASPLVCAQAWDEMIREGCEHKWSTFNTDNETNLTVCLECGAI